MKFLEKDLEEIIYEANNENLFEKGLPICGVKKRQLRIGNYGIADIVSFSRQHYFCDMTGVYNPCLNICVFELKKEKAGISAFLQAIRYCKGISEYLSLRKPNLKFKLQIVLIGKEIDTSSDYIFVSDLLASNSINKLYGIRNYSYSYDIDGIKFKSHNGYCLTNNGFKL